MSLQFQRSAAIPINTPKARLVERVTRMLDRKTKSWTPANGGYTPAERWIVRSESGAVFVKCGVTPHTAELLRMEFRAYNNGSSWNRVGDF
jgi:hypothetical protein